jgi:hypothetical protein
VLGCGSPGAVATLASITGASVTVEQLTLGTHLTGDFDLVVEVGAAASNAATVTPQSFSLSRDAQVLKSPINVAASGTVPFTVGIGEKKSVHFTIDDLLATGEASAICAGKLRIVGQISDSLSGKTLSVTSPDVDPAGCP